MFDLVWFLSVIIKSSETKCVDLILTYSTSICELHFLLFKGSYCFSNSSVNKFLHMNIRFTYLFIQSVKIYVK